MTKTKYTVPVCEYCQTTLHICEEVKCIQFRTINNSGKIKKDIVFEHKTKDVMIRILECFNCQKEWNIEEDEKGRVVKGDRYL